MKLAVYPGSFDPLTNGHLDLIKRAALLFDHVIVAISINSSKKPMFELDERKKMIEEVVSEFDNVTVDTVGGLIVDYISERENAVLIKGLRALSDFEMEFQMALMNRKLKPEVETLFLMTSMDYAAVSSSIVKEINRFGGDISELVPPLIAEAMVKRRG
ncbi:MULTISPECIES: pantetheine-phosphate adenylyltransferase [unclassified Fusibacter]|uniref:pantetheine-phosphate adenylyltransferase n=1 Tax=unclassified Fusibacter TaxID=2624464 RepID=UPI0010102885|nr:MULTISPECIES: pantetheine-phosphate adenylyltransferase [unclassified Fusibacter]MCK8058067.1 pantetheine-phosphate adenylyltransferase [Fusibacter sp. A2]NPE20649.1 pantetheine-phosphate adenylyltransferase [Fusibacter sp. A1]RXV62855.1 pantetheine-phosphate adenylyltransferase [Fusibacter sp. A1]